MNPASRQKTLPGPRPVSPARLQGYQRKINAPVNGYLYLNIIENPGSFVDGVVIDILPSEIPMLTAREIGYSCVDVSRRLDVQRDGLVIAFIAPDLEYPGLTIPRSYLDTCLAPIPEETRPTWLRSTIINNLIYDDRENPVYVNAAE